MNENEIEKEIQRLKEREIYGANGMVRFIAFGKRMKLENKLKEMKTK